MIQRILVASIAALLVAACAATNPDGKPASAQPDLQHPDAIAAMDWKVGDTCVTEYRFGYKRSVHTAVVTDVSNGRVTLSDAVDDGSVRVIVYEGTGGDHVAKRVAASDGQQIELIPAMKWLNFPLQPDSTWSDHLVVKGQTFQLDLDAKFSAAPWETVTVPAGQFAAIKVVTDEKYTAGRDNKGGTFTGSGNYTYWISPDTKCVVKARYKSSFGANTTIQLLSHKRG